MRTMQNWNRGYVTDIEYMDEFFPQLSPQFLALVMSLNGLDPPNLSEGFSCCELGCGKGLSSLIFAAANPNGQFHAIDFNPAHIAHAQAQARSARLDNITFHECSFEKLNGRDALPLPMFDVVTMHGVWSWIAPELQAAILEFLENRVKPGGLVYVSYNVMPHWALIAPLQRLLCELAALSPGGSDAAIRHAFAVLERLAEFKIISPALQEGLKQISHGQSPEHMLTYFAHEYLNEHWKPAYHADVARAFGSAKFTFACSADPLRSFSNLHLSEGQQAVLAEIPSPELRETLEDFAANTGLRIDIFGRGTRHMSPQRRDAALGAVRLALVKFPPDVIELPAPDQTLWRANPDAYRRFMAALQIRPHSVSELLALPGLPANHGITAAELVGVLIGTGMALPFEDASPSARAACARFNRLTEDEGEISLERIATMAVASLRMGVSFSPGDFDVYLAMRRGERAEPRTLARRFAARCRARGGYPIVDGKHYQNEAEAHHALTADYAKKFELLAPLWRNAGIVEN